MGVHLDALPKTVCRTCLKPKVAALFYMDRRNNKRLVECIDCLKKRTRRNSIANGRI